MLGSHGPILLLWGCSSTDLHLILICSVSLICYCVFFLVLFSWYLPFDQITQEGQFVVWCRKVLFWVLHFDDVSFWFWTKILKFHHLWKVIIDWGLQFLILSLKFNVNWFPICSIPFKMLLLPWLVYLVLFDCSCLFYFCLLEPFQVVLSSSTFNCIHFDRDFTCIISTSLHLQVDYSAILNLNFLVLEIQEKGRFISFFTTKDGPIS